jgi:diguanylate cyclase (GGDEF)-like protein
VAPRDLSNTMSGVLLALVRRERGEDAVGRVLAIAGDHRPVPEIEDSTQWSSRAQTRALYLAAIELTGDPDIARRAGSTVLHEYASGEVMAMMRSLGGPVPVFELAPVFASKQTTITVGECLEAREGFALISHRKVPPHRADPIWCKYAAGVYGSIPQLFGFPPAEVDEPECAVRGGGRCVFRIQWDPNPEVDLEIQNQQLRGQIDALTHRFESLESLATEITSIDDVDSLLETITNRAAVAVRAPRYLLVVTTPRDERQHVHQIGIDPSDLEVITAEVLDDPPDDREESRIIVDIASATQSFGRLAAIQDNGIRFAPGERRLLSAYAAHATAALVKAAALDETRTQVVTLRALLDLSADLAEVRSIDEACSRLAASVPKVLDCEATSVFVWDGSTGRLVCRARALDLPGGIPALGARADIVNEMALPPRLYELMVGMARPVSIGADAAEPALREMADVAGVSSGCAMPIVARGELLGVIVVADGRGDAGLLSARLPGVAGLAASTFASANLLEQVSHQALHDALTGLPNLRALERMSADVGDERVGPAALVFVDLDNFKGINDRFGHSAGDELLVEVGRRLQDAVRGNDVVVRIGGDEFAVLLAQVDDRSELEVIARRLLDRVQRTILIEGQPVEVTASIGVAARSLDSDTVEELLSRSDHAMYRAKMAGRATVWLAE